MVRIRLPFTPKPDDLAGLQFFMAYASREWEHAQRVREAFQRAGCTVTLYEPNCLPADLPAKEVSQQLWDSIYGSDGICVVASTASFESPWVRYEFTEGSALMGRIVFVALDTLPVRRGFITPTDAQLGARAIVKHAIISMTNDDTWIPHLLVEMCNDPDEWWFGDHDPQYERAWPKNLKHEIVCKKMARMSALMDPRNRGETIVEVIPIPREVCGPSADDACKWYINARGRPDLRNRILNDEVVVRRASYTVPAELSPDMRLDALVVLIASDGMTN